MPRILQLALITVALASAACAAPSAGGGSPLRRSALITPEEIRETHVSSAYHLLEQLRPSWLRTRGPASILLSAPIQVYINAAHAGDVSVLRQLSAQGVQRVERLGSSEATQRFGTDHVNGAILVTLY